jgi:putative tricarboxylic transport membrane protein
VKSIMKYGFTLLLIIVVAVALYASREWNATTALFPRAVGFPMLALLVAVLVMDIRKGRSRKESGKTEGGGDGKFSKATKLSLLYLAWLAGFVVLAWAIGLLYSIPIYVFVYMKIQGRINWLQCGVFAVAATVFVYIFGYMFQMAWPEGALLSIL